MANDRVATCVCVVKSADRSIVRESGVSEVCRHALKLRIAIVPSILVRVRSVSTGIAAGSTTGIEGAAIRWGGRECRRVCRVVQLRKSVEVLALGRVICHLA